MKPCLYLKASPQTDMTHRDSPINTLEMDIKMTIQRQSDFKILQNELLAALPMLLSANELCWALVRSTLTYIKKKRHSNQWLLFDPFLGFDNNLFIQKIKIKCLSGYTDL
jgi:hypothetical protein